MKIATLSSKKLGDSYEGSLKNNYLYQGGYSEMDDDIGWHDFMLRNYDAQIGRWVQQDPYQEFATSYTYVGNDPINLTDPTGGLSWPPPGLGKVVSSASGSVGNVLTISGQVGSAVNLLSKVSIIINTVSTAVNIISSAVEIKQVGKQVAGSSANNGEPGPVYGMGFWYNFGKGFKDGGVDTWNFVESLKTRRGWVNLLDGLNNINPMGVWTPEKVSFYASTPDLIMEELKKIPNMTIDDWGYAAGYGGEKVIEILLANKAAAVIKAKLVEVAPAAKGVGRIQAGSLKEFKSLVKQLSKPGSQLTKSELQQFEKLTQQFGGKLRYDLNPVKGKILQPHVQVEGLGTSVGSRHIWVGQ